MAHTHEFDCIVCGAHFDAEKDLQEHNQETHAPKQAIDLRAPAEPMGTERARRPNPEDRSEGETRFPTPKFGSAGSGGAEYEPGPERN